MSLSGHGKEYSNGACEHLVPLADELAELPPAYVVSNETAKSAKELKDGLKLLDLDRFPVTNRLETKRVVGELQRPGSSGWRGVDVSKLKRICARVAQLLRAEIGTAVPLIRLFPKIANSGLRSIVEREYDEPYSKLLPSNAVKSVVIVCGSIL